MTQVSQQRFGCYIGNIDRSVTLEVLRQVFSQCGTIVDCSLNGRDEDPYRYGFIDFASEDDRARAMKYNGFTLAGRKIKVGVSKGNVGRPEGFNNSNSNTNNNTNSNNKAMNNNNGNNNINQQPPQHMQQQQQLQAQPTAMAPGFFPGVIPQQQQSTQLLIQLIQQGVIDVNSLTPEQVQTVMAGLLPPAVPPAQGIPPIPPMVPMGFPPMQPAWVPPRGAGVGVAGGAAGGYMGGPPPSRAAPFTRGPANPVPTEETLKLREVQRKQYLDVVWREAEKYEKKYQERTGKEGKAGCVSGSEASSSDDEGDRRRRVHARREENGNDAERNIKAANHDTDRHHHQQQQDDNTTHNNEHATDAVRGDVNDNEDGNNVLRVEEDMEPHESVDPNEEGEPQEGGRDDREHI